MLFWNGGDEGRGKIAHHAALIAGDITGVGLPQDDCFGSPQPFRGARGRKHCSGDTGKERDKKEYGDL